jgi:hypothetical protein
MNIVTIKWGSRYPASYVNKLFRAAGLHGLKDGRFLCYTDSIDGLAPGIEVLPLPAIDLPEKYQRTFWRKLSLFDPTLGLKGPCLYFDLDVVIAGDLRPLLADWSGRPRFIKNWVGEKTARRAQFDQINSSVMLYNGSTCGKVLDDFHRNREEVLKSYPGDQGFVYDCLAEDAEFFDPGLCVSFKKHCIPRFPCNLWMRPKVPLGASVVVFHGKPDPHEAAHGYHLGRMKHWCRSVAWAE